MEGVWVHVNIGEVKWKITLQHIREFNVFNNTTVVICNNTKNITEKHNENFVKCPNVFWLMYLITLQEFKSQRLLISVRLDSILTQNAGEKSNEKMASLSPIKEL